jgi:hypothetical protein
VLTHPAQARLPDNDTAANVSLMWLPVASSDARASFELHEDAEGASHGARFQRIAHKGGSGAVGVANYGLNCQHGMVFIADRQYEGYTHLRAMHAPARGTGGARGEKVNVTIALHDWQRDTTLASSSFQLAPERGWVHVPLDFTPSANTTCGGALFASWGSAVMRFRTLLLHMYAAALTWRCASEMTADTPFGKRDDLATCSGRLVISTDTEGAVLDVDLTYLAPGEWGTEPAPWAGDLGVYACATRALVQTQCWLSARVETHSQGCRRGATWWKRCARSSSARCAWAAPCATWTATAGAHPAQACLQMRMRMLADAHACRCACLQMRKGLTTIAGRKYFRGPREERDPYRGYWYEEAGLTQSRSFGIFEIVDLSQARCSSNALGASSMHLTNIARARRRRLTVSQLSRSTLTRRLPIWLVRARHLAARARRALQRYCTALHALTLHRTTLDFVEYCHGDSSTTWGAIRAADGHPEPYRVTVIEIGNEVDVLADLCPKARTHATFIQCCACCAA